jgi:hypothetical protein
MEEELAERFSSVLVLSDDGPSSPASPGYFPELSRVERGLIRDTVKKIRQEITMKDRIGFPGLVYVAKQKGTRFTKVGYSKHEDASRIGQISGTCGLEFEKIYQVPILPYCAYRAEQILHKVLRRWGYDILNCKCLEEHREWYDKPFDFVITLAHIVHTWMRQEPYSTQTWELKRDWNDALDIWIASQDTKAPMAWSEFFLMGLLLRPMPVAFPGSPPTPSRFWGRRKSASVINVGHKNNCTPPPRPKGLVHANSSPASQHSDRTLDDPPFRDANSTPKRPSTLRAEITPLKPTSRRAVDQSPSETPVRHASSLNLRLSKKSEGFLGLSEAMQSKGDKGLSRNLLNVNNVPATTVDVAVAKEEQSTEEESAVEGDSTIEEDLTAENDLIVEEDSTAEKDLTTEEDSEAEEDSTAEEDPTVEEDPTTEEDPTAEEDLTVEEDPTAEEDLTAEEGSTTEEDPTAEEDLTAEEGSTTEEDPTAEEDSTAEEDPTAEQHQTAGEDSEEDLTEQEESLAGDDSTGQGSLDGGESDGDEGSDFQYASTTDEDSESDVEWTEEELARERQELTHEVRELLGEAKELEHLGRDDIMARLEETPAVGEIVVAPERPSTSRAKEPPFSDSSLDVRSKVLPRDSKADLEVDLKKYSGVVPEDELKSGLENKSPTDVFIQERCSNALPAERPAVGEDAAEEREELENESGRATPPTVQVKGSRLSRSGGDQGKEEVSASPSEHVLTSQGFAENGKSPASPTGKAPPKPIDQDKQNSHDKWKRFKGGDDLDFSTINSAKSPHSAQQLEATAVTLSGRARDLLVLDPFRKPVIKEGCEVVLQNTYTVHPRTAPSVPLRFRCCKCCHFDGNIISPNNEEILRSGGEILPPPQCVVCDSECPLFRYLSQDIDPEVQPIESLAPPENDQGSLRAFREAPFEADPDSESKQSTDSGSRVGDNVATLPRSTGLKASSLECTSTEKAAMVREQTSPRFAKEPPSYLFGKAPAGIQTTEFKDSHRNDTDWTGVFGGTQAEPHTSFPAREATNGHGSAGECENKS